MKKIIQGLLLALLFVSTASSFAEEIKIAAIVPKPIGGIPKTEQTTSYVNYDDGYYQKSLPASGSHYQNNGNGTITDNATGLMWVQRPELIIPGPPGVPPANQIQRDMGDWHSDTDYVRADLVKDKDKGTFWVCVENHRSIPYDIKRKFADDRASNLGRWRETKWVNALGPLSPDPLSPSPIPASMIWSTAITNCNQLVFDKYAGYDDWRLPNIKELQSIVDYGVRPPPAIDKTIFPNTSVGTYWSSTTCADSPGKAWYVDGQGTVGSTDKSNNNLFVRPVRGGR